MSEEIYSGKKMKAICPDCGKDIMAWKSRYIAQSGKVVEHYKFTRHKCEAKTR